MFQRILSVLTVIVIILTAVLAYNGATAGNGSLIDLQRCGDGTDFYSRHEFQCDTMRFVIPFLVSPIWLILIVLWSFVWLDHNTRTV